MDTKKGRNDLLKAFAQCVKDELREGEYTEHEKAVIEKAIGRVMEERISKAGPFKGGGGIWY